MWLVTRLNSNNDFGVPKMCFGTKGQATKKQRGTFGHPEDVLGDNGTGYQITGHLTLKTLSWDKGTGYQKNGIFGHPKATWDNYETFGHPKRCSWDNEDYQKQGHLDIPKMCLRTTGQATNNGTLDIRR
ncbi:hypothetical protein AVEN_172546-1 [Araneus ventricosus]|uniref:Uncharacterized protein n=1 Tax=Araneus ventricosus TaxID=182803 RepID=A0A4Y2MFT0_ARAVE|nr:hypothetical protein AVEN_172546-1 [Araneus ventricosus]